MNMAPGWLAHALIFVCAFVGHFFFIINMKKYTKNGIYCLKTEIVLNNLRSRMFTYK